MSLKSTLYVWEHVHDVTPAQKLMLLAIADHADPDGYAMPGMNKLAKACCDISRNYAQTLIRALQEKGLIEVRTEQGLQTVFGRTNLYIIKGVKEWASPLKQDAQPANNGQPANNSGGVGANHSGGEGLTIVSPNSQLNSQLKKKEKDSAPSGAGKKLSDHQLLTGIVQSLYKDNPACPNGMDFPLAAKISAALRGTGKGSWRIKALVEHPMSVDEARGLQQYVTERGVTPSLDPDKFSQLVFSYRSSPRQAELVTQAAEAYQRKQREQAAAEQRQAVQPEGDQEMVAFDFDAALGIGDEN